MATPKWKVRIYIPIWLDRPRNPSYDEIVEAYTGPAAEAAALEKHPGGKVVECTRLTGFREDSEIR
jgi:hypothetical protein